MTAFFTLSLSPSGRESGAIWWDEPPKVTAGRLTSGDLLTFGPVEITAEMARAPMDELVETARACRDKRPVGGRLRLRVKARAA